MTTKYEYVGRGGYLTGVPRRDLTDVDWARLTDEQKTAVRQSALYTAVSAKKKQAKKEGE